LDVWLNNSPIFPERCPADDLIVQHSFSSQLTVASSALAYRRHVALQPFEKVLVIMCGGATATIEQLLEWSAQFGVSRNNDTTGPVHVS
jgi:hypothetical protein